MRYRFIVPFIVFIALCSSMTYWSVQLFQPGAHSLPMPTLTTPPTIDQEAAVRLFGEQSGGRFSSFALTSQIKVSGIVAANNSSNSVAILLADNKNAQATAVGKEILPGVKVEEIHPDYVLLSDHGRTQRIALPVETKKQPLF